jgi:hypothetical protein
MTPYTHEYVATSLKTQIDNLKEVMEDIETDWIDQERLGWRLKAIELSLKHLRDAA